MDKNMFFIFNDIVYHLYACRSLEDLKNDFLVPLKMLVPYSFASILLTDPSAGTDEIRFGRAVCIPDSFEEAENIYMDRLDEDPLLWILHTKESTLVRESELLPEEERLSSPLYRSCYQKYHIFDSVQYSIVYRQKMLGILTLYHTRIDGTFTNEDMFRLRSLGIHLNAALHNLLEGRPPEAVTEQKRLDHFRLSCGLTPRETQILQLLLTFSSNEEITDALGISTHTLQKHMQNIFRKTGVSSRWELLKKGQTF
ncbi:MAG TPA: hypothetical protein IAA57_00360 [Candidatus Pullilachnospira intestinigallinarum]|nr:hypothetical protein [Candidatus Pullilachnospira intestinigallinarum]